MNRHFSPLIPEGQASVKNQTLSFEDWWTDYAEKITTASDLEKAAARAAWDYVSGRER